LCKKAVYICKNYLFFREGTRTIYLFFEEKGTMPPGSVLAAFALSFDFDIAAFAG